MILLKPRNPKFKKQQRGKFRRHQHDKLQYGVIGVVALTNFWFSSNQMEACRKTILRYTKRVGRIYLKTFPDKPISQRTEGSRMGTGKGSTSYWVMPIRRGKVLFELRNVSVEVARKAFNQLRFKIPTKIILYEKNWNNIKQTKI